MARRRQKKRTHVPDPTKQNPTAANTVTAKTPAAATSSRTPKTMVIRTGASNVGPAVSSLVRDMRKVMEPYTATRLRERKSNKLKDFTTMAGPLGVTQILAFGRSENGNVNLRVIRTPRGPTLHFKVVNYSLCKDVVKGQRHGGVKATGKEYLTPPLLVMNSLVTPTSGRPADHEFLTQSMFQSMIPPISAQTISLQSVKRVLLLNRQLPDLSDVEKLEEGEEYVLDLRHYSISTRPTGVPRSIRKLHRAKQPRQSNGRGSLPNLGQLEDISEFLLDPSAAGGGYTSESDMDTDAEVEVAVPNLQKTGKVFKETTGSEAEKRAVKLQELGPRMRLQLVKVEEGVNDGKILWHSFIKKTKQEARDLELRAKDRQKIKEQRRSAQEANVKRKQDEKKKKTVGEGDEGGDEMDVEDSELEKATGWDGDEDIWSDDDVQDDSEEEETSGDEAEDSDEDMED